MTVRIPSRTLGDRILGVLGKKRAVFIPGDVYREHGPYVYAQAKREGFFKALFGGKELKEGWVYLDDFEDGRKNWHRKEKNEK